jgi:hypothetical protein
MYVRKALATVFYCYFSWHRKPAFHQDFKFSLSEKKKKRSNYLECHVL